MPHWQKQICSVLPKLEELDCSVSHAVLDLLHWFWLLKYSYLCNTLKSSAGFILLYANVNKLCACIKETGDTKWQLSIILNVVFFNLGSLIEIRKKNQALAKNEIFEEYSRCKSDHSREVGIISIPNFALGTTNLYLLKWMQLSLISTVLQSPTPRLNLVFSMSHCQSTHLKHAISLFIQGSDLHIPLFAIIWGQPKFRSMASQ